MTPVIAGGDAQTIPPNDWFPEKLRGTANWLLLAVSSRSLRVILHG
jgi:hypothetical protein